LLPRAVRRNEEGGCDLNELTLFLSDKTASWNDCWLGVVGFA
jgi:hypothetical protein